MFFEFDYDEWNNPVVISIRRGNYQAVEYLISACESEYLAQLSPLHLCIYKSVYDSDHVIENKIQILKLILLQCPELVQKKGRVYKVGSKYFAHLSDEANFRLIKLLIEAGAPLDATDNGRNIAHEAGSYCSEKEYHELVTILIEKGLGSLFNQRDEYKYTPLHCALWRVDVWTETLELLAEKCQVTFNNKERLYSQTELDIAKRERSHRVIDDIVRLGGELRAPLPASDSNSESLSDSE